MILNRLIHATLVLSLTCISNMYAPELGSVMRCRCRRTHCRRTTATLSMSSRTRQQCTTSLCCLRPSGGMCTATKRRCLTSPLHTYRCCLRHALDSSNQSRNVYFDSETSSQHWNCVLRKIWGQQNAFLHCGDGQHSSDPSTA